MQADQKNEFMQLQRTDWPTRDRRGCKSHTQPSEGAEWPPGRFQRRDTKTKTKPPEIRKKNDKSYTVAVSP